MAMHKKLVFFILISDMVFLKYVVILFRGENIRLGVVKETARQYTYNFDNFKYIRK